MAQPYVGEIRMFGGNFAPAGWAFCDGSILPISEYETLFNLIGTTYGGDGQSTFAMPDLRGRLPIHQGSFAGSSRVIGETFGTETETLTVNQIPNHSHAPAASSKAGSSSNPVGNVWAANSNTASPQFAPSGTATDVMNTTMLAPAGGSQPHDNMPPYLCVSFIISLFGIFPSPT